MLRSLRHCLGWWGVDMQAADDEFDGLMVHEQLSFSWRLLDAPPSESELVHLCEANEALLRVCATLDDAMPRLSNEASEVAQELVRFDAKLNLLLEMVSELLHTTRQLPQMTPLELGAQGLRFPCAQLLAPPSLLLLDVYACPQFPKALRLFARVLDGQEDLEGYRITARFEGLSTAVTEGLEKLVFRRHRRSIALRKHKL